MERTIPAAIQEELEQSASGDALLAFLTITHPNLSTPIRVVADALDYVKDSVTFTGVLFGFQLLSDNERPPVTQLTVPNVDRKIGEAIQASSERAKVQLEICSSADFDLTVDPRTEVGTAATVYSFTEYELTDVTADAAQLSGTVFLRDYAQEPWPSVAATQDRLPGLYR